MHIYTTTTTTGYDDNGREYWKFPTSDDLFICITTTSASSDNTTSGTTFVDQCRAEFNALLAAERVTYDTTSNDSGEGMDVDQDIAALNSAGKHV